MPAQIEHTYAPASEQANTVPAYGALVISLDFELHWGMRDIVPATDSYRETLIATRHLVPQLLDLFEEFDIAATWATVGLLFARSRHEAHQYRPAVQPAYADAGLAAYGEPLGASEEADPIHFAPSLIGAIRRRPRQEIGTHTFSHYYCLEPGQSCAAFRADLESACAIAQRYGIELRSIVFPRNQVNPAYLHVLHEFGISCYRDTARGWMYRAEPARRKQLLHKRGTRLLDSYVNLSGHNLIGWHELRRPDGLYAIRDSMFLRSHNPRLRHLQPLHLRRIVDGIEAAGTEQKIFHLWWHPQDFGHYPDENIAFLRNVLEAFARCREQYGMRSLTMNDLSYAVQRVMLVFGMVLCEVPL
jgi:peptidoglycan/xylan/chitin deacetylase (PgdA/CDA1 family)